MHLINIAVAAFIFYSGGHNRIKQSPIGIVDTPLQYKASERALGANIEFDRSY